MSSETTTAGMFETTNNEAKSFRGRIIAAGIISLVLGTAAVIDHGTATIASVGFFGALLIFVGAVEIVQAFQVRTWTLARAPVHSRRRQR